MKLRLRHISAIFAATAALGAFGNALSDSLDAHSHAATLLSGGGTSKASEAHRQTNASSSDASADAHASAAALLTGDSPRGDKEAAAPIASSDAPRAQQDAHAHAAALLSGSRNLADQRSSTTGKNESIGEHPAVLVARTYSTRGIDPNHFIVMHPARLQWVDVSSTK